MLSYNNRATRNNDKTTLDPVYIINNDGFKNNHVMKHYSAYYCPNAMGLKHSFEENGSCKMCKMTIECFETAKEKAINDIV